MLFGWNRLLGQSAFHEHHTKVLWHTNRNHLAWRHKLTTAWHKKIVFGTNYYSFVFFNKLAWFQLGVNLYTKKLVGTKLARIQICQIYLWHDENMECTLAVWYCFNYCSVLLAHQKIKEQKMQWAIFICLFLIWILWLRLGRM